MQNTLRIGKLGEDEACAYIAKLGYKLYARNERIGHDEIDLVAYDPKDKVIVFIEVKTRSKSSAYSSLLNITPAKKKCMLRAARAWVDQKLFEGGYRLDVICIEHGKVVHHIQDISSGSF